MPGLYFSAAHKSSGKTTVTLGIARALAGRGTVQVFKKGPDYIDPIWHALASRRPCYNLDYHLMRRDEIDTLYDRHAHGAGISLVEGNKGLYDGMDIEGSNSNAALARQLGLPVVLILDTTGMTRGVAPLVLGYQAFDPQVRIAGVILNKVGGPRHEEKLRAVLARYTDVPVLGAVPRDSRLAIAERHLGLIPGNEMSAAETRIEAVAEIVSAHVDIDALSRIAASAATRAAPAPSVAAQDGQGLTLGYSLDRVFGFYYQEDLDTLRAAGVALRPIDTLDDAALPTLDGLLLGGGFPEVFVETLEANASLRASVRQAIESGLPVYAECGGLMYLSQGIAWGDRTGAMVGVLPAWVRMGERPVGRGYAVLEGNGASPLAVTGQSYNAHEFHHSALVRMPDAMTTAYRVVRGHGLDGRNDGYIYKNLLASYCHRRGSGPHGWIQPLLALMRRYREQGTRSSPSHNALEKEITCLH